MTQFEHLHAGLRFSVAESGQGRLFLFQHGLCGDASQPADVFPAGIGWRCLTLECRGHGASEPGSPDDYSLATFADDVASLIERHSLPPVVLGGISMGAAITLRLAVRRPDLVRALVLARPAWVTESAPPNMQPNAAVGELLQRFPADAARARFDTSETAARLAAEAPDNLASLRGFFSREPIAITRELLCRISADGPGVASDALRELDVPTLVIGHRQDLLHPLAYAQTLATAIPAAHLVEITPKAESRDRYRTEFRSALAAFLKEL